MELKYLNKQIWLLIFSFICIVVFVSYAEETEGSSNNSNVIAEEQGVSLNFGKHGKEFKDLWDELENFSLPIKYSFQFLINLPNFKKVPKNLVPLFNTEYFYDHMIAKMPKKDNLKLFLLAATVESGDKIIFLGSINDDIKLLEIYSAMDYDLDGQLGTMSRLYEISEEYEIIVSEFFTPFDSSMQGKVLIKKEIYSIDSNGDFIQVQD